MAFKPRLTKPEAGNKYYIRKVNGGYSNAIAGKPCDPDCNVLANCVGYAYGRFNEIGGYGYCKYLAPVNAENFIQYKGSCKVGQTPKLGAVMVWRKGATLSGSDGAGHVAIVEKILSDTEVVTSESGYGSKAFWTQTRKKGSNGRWGSGSAYTFLGFIYNPAVPDLPDVTPAVSRNKYKNQVQVKITNLRVRVAPGTDQTVIGFAKSGYYNYTSTKTADGYTWYEIADDQWVAFNKDWITVFEAVEDNRIEYAKSQDKTLEGSYKVTAEGGLHLRAGAGTGKRSLEILKFGAIVKNYGYYTVDNGIKWLVVKTATGRVGYCSSKYLKKI